MIMTMNDRILPLRTSAVILLLACVCTAAEGPISGDAVIRGAANSVRMLIRADDLLFRWGGAEFGDQCSLDKAMKMADREMYDSRRSGGTRET